MDAREEAAVFGRLVAARAEEEPERVALVFENGQLPDETASYHDLALNGNQFAWELRRAGFVKGDRMAVMLRNHPEFVFAMVANSRLGLATVPIDPRARGERLSYYLRFAGCNGVVVADYTVADPAAAEVIRDSGAIPYVVTTAEGEEQGVTVPGGMRSFNESLSAPQREDVGQHVDSLRQPWLLSYTSGTTGDPKAIVFGYDRMLFYRLVPGFFGYVESDVPYTGLSLSH